MRNARIKRKRAAIKSLQSSTKPPRAHASIPIVQESKKVVTESELAEKNELEKKVNLYKRMARSFWERWQWELKERKDASMREKILSHQKRNIVVTPMNALQIKLHNINRALLSDPIPQGTVVLGQGSFGIVKLKTFRGMYVAVKELFSRTVLSDVHNEARMLMQVCHPFLPYYLEYPPINSHIALLCNFMEWLLMIMKPDYFLVTSMRQ